MPHRLTVALGVITAGAVTLTAAPPSHADNDDNTLIPNNHRFNNSVVSNVYTMQRQAGCTNSLIVSPQLQQAAHWQTDDMMNNRNLNSDIGSDGSTPQDRAHKAGFAGNVAETVAINPALAMSGMELINNWYYNPDYAAIMRDCTNTQIGVWSENSLDRTVVVAVYGQPPQPPQPPQSQGATALASGPPQNVPPDPSPDYDMSDELEYGLAWLPWILRGVYPPPAYPSQ
jgi:uncharacterized protein YkwD